MRAMGPRGSILTWSCDPVLISFEKKYLSFEKKYISFEKKHISFHKKFNPVAIPD
jgi:hypothetical protein